MFSIFPQILLHLASLYFFFIASFMLKALIFILLALIPFQLLPLSLLIMLLPPLGAHLNHHLLFKRNFSKLILLIKNTAGLIRLLSSSSSYFLFYSSIYNLYNSLIFSSSYGFL